MLCFGGVALHSMRLYSRFLSQHLNYYFRKRAICASRFLRIRYFFSSFFYIFYSVSPPLAFHVFAYECGSTAAAAAIFLACFEASPSPSPMRYVWKISFNAKILNVYSPTGDTGSAANYAQGCRKRPLKKNYIFILYLYPYGGYYN